MTLRLASLFLVALATGCMTTPVQRAETLGEGDFAFGIEPGIHGASVEGVTGVVPGFNLSGRYGVTDRFDLGARFGSSSYEIMAKIMLTDPASGTPISLAPATTFAAFGGGGASAGFFRIKLPLLIGVPVGRSQLVLGPTLTNNIAIGASGGQAEGGYNLGAGGSLGFNGRVGDAFAIHPEFGLNYNVVTTAGGGSASGGIGFAFTLGLIVGNKLDD